MNWLKNVSIFLVIAGSLCLEQIVTACGGGEDPYDYYTSFFHNNTAGSAAYMPFSFVANYQYYGVSGWGWEEQTHTPDEDQNLKEWQTFANNKFQPKDAQEFVYKYSYEQLSNLYYHIEKGKALQLPDSVQKNGMTQWFLQDKDLEALGYLMFAKKCQPHAGSSSDWETPKRDVTAMTGSLKGGLQLWKAAKKDFFKWRYAYQVLRLAFYSEDYQRTFYLYKELVGDKTADNIMYYRCLSIKAGAFYKTGDYNTAAYLYSLAFNGTDDNKMSNYVSYDWCFSNHGEAENGPTASRKTVLALTKSNEQKAVISVMDALHEYNDGLPLMKEAYALDPKVKGLDVVMTREINKLEMNVLSPALNRNRGFKNYYYTYSNYYYNYNPEETAESRKLRVENEQNLKALISFGTRISEENKTTDPAFWPLSVAYLYFIQQDWKNCEAWIAKAEKMNPQGKVKDMLHIEQLLLTINKNQKLDAATEAKILPSLQWLEQRADKDNRFSITYRNLMTVVLPNVYMKQQDTMKALLCIARGTTGFNSESGFYYVDPGSSVELEQVTTAQIITMKDWIKSAKKSAYESFLVKYEPYQKGALDMYIGTRYIRQLDFAKAVDILKNVPKEGLTKYSFQDPFAERWIDTQEPKDTIMVSDKLAFAKQMLELQQNISKSSAEQIYKYANGLYSMTYYGLSWGAAMYSRSGSDGLAYYADTVREKLLPEYRNYYSAKEASTYYQLAFDKATDKELKAKCLFMLSKCWQKNAPIVKEYFYDPAANDAYYTYNLQSPYFLQLNKDYNQTKTFKILFEECSYLKMYVRKMNKQ
ncbi:MAG: hypothetical protein WC756_03190 [Taibaiella sp.]|jgi:hypothetical protein